MSFTVRVYELAVEGCYTRFEAFVGMEAKDSEWYLDALFPSGYSWRESDDRNVNCLVAPGSKGFGVCVRCQRLTFALPAALFSITGCPLMVSCFSLYPCSHLNEPECVPVAIWLPGRPSRPLGVASSWVVQPRETGRVVVLAGYN